VLETKQLKVVGLRYARALQAAVKTAIVFPADHPACKTPVEQSFAALNALLKQVGQFTLGFVDHQVLLNQLLTVDPSVQRLENEFLKRGIGAVCFEPGITLARYRQLIAVLSTPAKIIEEVGVGAFLQRQTIEGVRLLPAPKNQKRTEDGDTLLETDSAAYVMSKQFDQEPVLMDSLESLLESAAIEKSVRSAMLADFAANQKAAPQAGPAGGHPRGAPNAPGGYLTLIEMMEESVQKAFIDPRGNPEKSYLALAQLLQGTSLDLVLSHFPQEQQTELRSLPREHVAAEFVEDTVLEWAKNRIASASPNEERFVVEEEVVRALLRTVQATQVADRLALKLSKFVQEQMLPKHVQERMRDELHWTALSASHKQQRLLALVHYDVVHFRRLIEHIQDLLREGAAAQAVAMAVQYLKILEQPAGEIRPEEISRIPELIRAMSGQDSFVAPTIARLEQALIRTDVSAFYHFQVTLCLTALSQGIAVHEGFEQVYAIGSMLERTWNTDRAAHERCCHRAFRQLVPGKSIERLIELFLLRRDDSTWIRVATTVLRWAEGAAIEKMFAMLEAESNAKNRIALIRLLGVTGQAGMEIVQQKLTDQRWYVVRNACLVLGELKDPELPARLTPLLHHSEERVQQAAAAMLIRNRAEGRARIMADALLHLHPSVLEHVLDELIVLRDPAVVPSLQQLVVAHGYGKEIIRKAAQVLAATGGDSALETLAQFLIDPTQDLALRRIALSAIAADMSERSRAWLFHTAVENPNDPLASECELALRNRNPQQATDNKPTPA
jgi:HEAT repeat protein